MHEHTGSEAHDLLTHARQVEERTRLAGRWFPSYLVTAGGLAFATVVAFEVFFPTRSGWGYVAAQAGLALALGLLLLWGQSHDVYPHGASRRLTIAVTGWFLGYLLLVGPLVRWQAGDALEWWTLAAALLAAPFFIGAWRARRRS